MRNPIVHGVWAYAIVAFLVAVVMGMLGGESLLGSGAEGFSRACENLALIAIALGVWVRRGAPEV